MFCAMVLALSIAFVTGAGAQALKPSLMSLGSSANFVNYAQSLAFTVTVFPQSPFTGLPTGTVTFSATCTTTPTPLGQATLNGNGQRQFITKLQIPGNGLPCQLVSVTAQYNGDANFSGTQATIQVSVSLTPVSVTITPASTVLILGGNFQQYAATAHYSDGSTVDATCCAAWTSSNTAVATINGTGLASTTGPGNTGITGSLNGVFAQPAVLGVVTPGASVLFLGGGSSAMFLELGQAAQSSAITATPCVWTRSRASNNSSGQPVVEDNRASSSNDFGDMWITWGPGTGTCASPVGNFNIYAYTSLDSAAGARCYFEVDNSGIPGCVQGLGVVSGLAGENLLCNGASPCVYGPDTPMPQAVISAVDQQHWFAAGTDILPEDAKFAVYRMLQPCGQTAWRQPFDLGLRQTYGLGYGGAVRGVGITALSNFSGTGVHTLDFNTTGRDPLNTEMFVPAYTVSTLGAKPIIVAVSPADGTGLGAASDVSGFNLALFMDGTLGRTTDLIGPTATSPVTMLINEPLSGAYNVMEYTIPNSSQFHSSQDANNCSGSNVFSNPMHLQSANGKVSAFRSRVVGTNEMIQQIQAGTPSDQRLGYFFWSAANAATFTAANGKYLTVNGVDPLQDTYTDGVLPGSDSAHPLSNVTFKWLNMGDYPLWSVTRIVSQSPTPAGVASLILAAQGLNASQNNFISPQNLQVWHSHYYLPAIGSGVAALGTIINYLGDLCSTAGPVPGGLSESGGDAGGANTPKQANADFCVDFANINGLINKAN
jgi:hypothetical protein